MATLAELNAWKDALQAARFSGNRRVKIGNTEIEYRSDSEMRAALDDLEFQVSRASGANRIAQVRFSISKGY